MQCAITGEHPYQKRKKEKKKKKTPSEQLNSTHAKIKIKPIVKGAVTKPVLMQRELRNGNKMELSGLPQSG